MKSFLKNVLASLTGFFIGIFIVVLVLFAVIGSMISKGTETVTINDNTVLELTLTGDVPERGMDEDLFSGTQLEGFSGKLGLDQIISGLDAAKTDSKIKGILLRADLYNGGLGTAEEIRTKILDFRKSGKFVIAYSEVLTDAGYFIASACDKIYLNPKGIIEFNGFSGKVAFYTGLLDKAGVEIQVFKAGKYKGAVEPFIQNELSEPNREQIQQYVNGVFGHHIKSIASSRNMDSAQLALIANQFLARTAKTALQYKLIDGLLYEDEVEDILKSKTGRKATDDFKLVAFTDYDETPETKYSSNKIAVIYATGDISMGKNESGDGIGSESLSATLKKARLDKSIKAIVLRVNSPGGSSNASDIIAREIQLCKKAKPVIVSFGDVAASGGYYIAAYGDSIFAYPNSITGSIGVFAMVPNTSKMYKQHLGLAYETVPTGEFAAGWTPDAPLSDGMKAYFQEMVQEIYTDFIGIVAKGRKMDESFVATLAEGHVYTATKAKELGLIDNYGNLHRAIQSAAWKSGLKEYRVVHLPEKKGAIEQLFGKQNRENVEIELLKSTLGDFYTPVQQLKKATQVTGPQMRMPWDIEMR